MPRPAFAPWLGQTNAVTAGFLSAGGIPGMINMGGGLPAPETFPVAELADLAAQAVRDHPAETLGYGPVTGLPALRAAIAARFSRGNLHLSADNVLITTAGMQALDLIGKVLLTPGAVIASQSPTYLGALDAWRPHGPVYRPMRLEDNDFDPLTALTGAQFGYTVPNFSNPTGRLVGLGQRQALVDAAQATGTWLVEDDPYGGLHYDSPALPRLLDLAGDGRPYDGPVIYMGTLSKEIVPGLRIGWIIAAPAMIAALGMAKQGSDMCTSGLTQHIALATLDAGLIERIQPGVLDLYRTRRDALIRAMNEHLKPWFDWDTPSGGMFVWATARDPGLDTDALITRATSHGVTVTPGSVFDPMGQDRRSIRINFTHNPPEVLAEGVARLARALKG